MRSFIMLSMFSIMYLEFEIFAFQLPQMSYAKLLAISLCVHVVWLQVMEFFASTLIRMYTVREIEVSKIQF